MKKTLMRKYLSVNTFILVISFSALSIMLWIIISNYWRQEKHQLLTQNAKVVANLVQERTVERNGEIYITEGSVMQAFMTTFASNINAEIFITNVNGEEIFCSEGDGCKHSNVKIPYNVVQEAMSGTYAKTSTLDDIYPNDYYVVGLPIKVSDDHSENIIGVVFTASDTQNLYSFRMDILQAFFMSAILAFVLSFLVIILFSYRMIRPLKQMSSAAKSFGNGDFSTRIQVNSMDEIGQLATSLNDMADSLSASESIRRNFIANVSHELRTPMTTISGFVDGILDGTIAQDKQTHYLNIVSSEIKRLSRLVKSMIGLSKIDSGTLKLNIQNFDISKIIFEALMSFEEKIEAKNVNIIGLDSLESVFVDADLDLIHQVIYNLIENAVKFVDYDGYIRISLKNNKSEVIVRIKNSGQGIASDELKMIFDRFYKTDKSRSQDKNGLGLGLYIVKTIIKLHGGTISASSKLNEYTQFEFCLPKDKNQVD